MNRNYEELIRALSLPDTIRRFAMGQIHIPVSSLQSPAVWFGFPPALIPLCCDPSLLRYFGCWKHWFSRRKISYVSMSVRSGRKVYEIARSADQFFAHITMTAICVHDGITPAVDKFSKEVNVISISQINDISLKTGDDPKGYKALESFGDALPLESVQSIDEYNGEFPTKSFATKNHWWQSSSIFEVSQDCLDNWPESISRPPWMNSCNIQYEFDNFCEAGDLHSAWLMLNSHGWSIAAAKAALEKLSNIAKDPIFTLLASAWQSVADDRSGGY